MACVVAFSLHTQRVAAAGYTVTAFTDSGTGSGTAGDLRYAINQVNASSDPGNTITFSVTGTITLGSTLPALAKPVAITGPTSGPGVTVQATATPNSGTYGVFFVNGGVTANISALTIANGNSSSNGGVFNGGTLTVTNSTLSGNSALDGPGGGIFNDINSTLTMTNSTFSGNSAEFGGGISNNGSLVKVNLTNTIVAGNTARGSSPDINGTVVSNGHNLIGDTSGSSGITNGDAQGDIVNPTPLLGPLASNGGPTQTRALLAGSPAIGAGNSAVCNSTTAPPGAPVGGTDQRGLPRPTTTCSIGAFEPPTITLSPATLPNAALGAPYNQTITASGSTAPYTFAVTSGALPPGLTLATNGTLSGKPTGAGTFTFTITATDYTGSTGSRTYTLWRQHPIRCPRRDPAYHPSAAHCHSPRHDRPASP